MNHLLRELAPISEEGWNAIDEEARLHLTRSLAGRRLVDFNGPHGWEYSASTAGGRISGTVASEPVPGAHLRTRRVISAVELRVPFTVSRAELAALDRGATDLDFVDLDAAAQKMAHAENHTIFHGASDAGITGLIEASPYPPVSLEASFDQYPRSVAWAVERLREAGIDGPYALALGPADYTGVVETIESGGIAVAEHLQQILDGPIVWGPGLEHALVVSRRGGDYVFDSGQDISVGYSHHDDENVYLYLEESFTFRVDEPGAAITFKP